MADIVGIGCAVFDMMLKLDRFPEEDEKFGAEESKVQCNDHGREAGHFLGFHGKIRR